MAVLFPLQFPDESRVPARLKLRPEDFQVTELSDQEPGGSGDFALVEVCKRDLPTHALVKAVAEHWGLRIDQIGVAGFKDRLALTRQRLSLPAAWLDAPPPDLPGLVEWKPLGLHERALRPGDLRANRFRIRLEGPGESEGRWLERSWGRQSAVGWANYYGIQRFGAENRNWELGLEQLRKPPARALRRRWPHNFVLSSVQSQLFNRFLERRIAAGRFAVVGAGDWCVRSGELFRAGGTAEEQRDSASFALLPLGPIWGYKLMDPSAEERVLLEELGLTGESFRPFRAPGSRRPWRLPLPRLEWTAAEGGLMVDFELPPGSYATVLLEHFFQLADLEPADRVES